MFFFLFVCIQSPYHFIFPDFKNRTWWHFMCSVQTKKKKEKKDRIYNQNFNVKFKLRVSFFFCFFFLFEPGLWKLVIRREKQRCTGQLLDLLQHPLISDCIPLYPGLILNYFKPLKLYLIVNNSTLGLAPLLSVAFTETCPVYRLFTVTLWSMNLQYKFLI